MVWARETIFNAEAQPAGEMVNVALVNFNILDKDPTKDDCMRIATRAIRRFDQFQPDDLDQGWLILIEKARAGFDRYCKPVPDEVELRRLKFLEQMHKGSAEGPDLSVMIA